MQSLFLLGPHPVLRVLAPSLFSKSLLRRGRPFRHIQKGKSDDTRIDLTGKGVGCKLSYLWPPISLHYSTVMVAEGTSRPTQDKDTHHLTQQMAIIQFRAWNFLKYGLINVINITERPGGAQVKKRLKSSRIRQNHVYTAFGKMYTHC